MGKTIAEITMSLDGFIAGPGISNKQPMGAKGELLHEWIFAKATPADKQWLEELLQTTGAVITGNHTYATAIGEAWGGGSPFNVPAFVLCHSVPSKQVNGFTYITGGIHEALKAAKETAGEKNIWIMGGANIIQQYMKAGLIEELRLHIAPVLLQQGTRLFYNTGMEAVELIKVSFTETAAAVHTVFRFAPVISNEERNLTLLPRHFERSEKPRQVIRNSFKTVISNAVRNPTRLYVPLLPRLYCPAF